MERDFRGAILRGFGIREIILRGGVFPGKQSELAGDFLWPEGASGPPSGSAGFRGQTSLEFCSDGLLLEVDIDACLDLLIIAEKPF